MLQEHVQGFRQPTELSNLLPLEEICELDRVTNRPYFIVNKISREIRSIKECPAFTARERQGMTYVWIMCSNILIYVKTYFAFSLCIPSILRKITLGTLFLIARNISSFFFFYYFTFYLTPIIPFRQTN